LVIIAGVAIAAIGFVGVLQAPNSSSYALEAIGLILIINPPNIFTIIRNTLPKLVPRWLALFSVLVFDASSFVILSLGAGSNAIDLVNLLSALLSFYVCMTSIRAIFVAEPHGADRRSYHPDT
jgi:hypothetical protein